LAIRDYGLARGFESKDVEFQQAEAQRAKVTAPALTPEQRAVQARRRTLELALARARADLAVASAAAHRQMLQQAIAALEEQMGQAT
jgi:cobalamin biosynthesis protein CbiD